MAAIFAAVLIYLVFVPSLLFSKHFATSFNQTEFYCGGADVKVTTSVGGVSLIVNYSEFDENSNSTDKAIEIFYAGSAIFSDYYLAKTGEGAEYDGELKLYNFYENVNGSCY